MIDIEKTLKEIDKILETLESAPIEEGVANFERAVDLSEKALKALTECNGKLLIIKDKINKLEEDFDIDE